MNADVKMDGYERDIVTELARLQDSSAQEAAGTVARYLHVLRQLGRYPSPEDTAESLKRILDKGWSPERWEAHVRKIDRIAQKREGVVEATTEAPVYKDEITELKQEISELQQKVNVLADAVSKVTKLIPAKISTRTASKRVSTGEVSQAARTLSGSGLAQTKAHQPAPKRAGARKGAVKT